MSACTSEEENLAAECEAVQEAEAEIVTAYESHEGQPLPEPTATDEMGKIFEQLEHARVQSRNREATREAYEDAIREMAVLVEQNSECYTPEERAKIQARYRELKGD